VARERWLLARMGAVAAAAMVAAMPACTGGEGAGSPRPSPTAASTAVSPTSAAEGRLTIFHATHLDGNYFYEDGRTFAHYAALLKHLRSALPDPGASLFLGNGDDITPELRRRTVTGYDVGQERLADSGGLGAIAALNAAGLDVDTYGYNELEWLDRLVRVIPRARFAVVSANVQDRRVGEVYGAQFGARQWVIKNVGGVRIGITGLLNADAARFAGPEVQVLDPVTALREVVPRLRAAGADLVVVLSHLDTRTEAQQVAKNVAGVDLILGTHIGELLPEPTRVDGALLSVPQFGLEGFGQLDLTVSKGRLIDVAFRQHTVRASGPEDPEVSSILRRYGGRPG